MTPPFDRILVANRGEIAVRIIRACREMGIGSVAVYSEPDAGSLHVRLADEAYPIGPAPALQSYLRMEALIQAAEETGAQAIHPGYGFLAENPEFARLVAEAGLTWIGPPADVIALLGDKLAAKRLAMAAGVPVVPGFEGDGTSAWWFVGQAEQIGFPVMIKAAAGGGGKGMRVVNTAAELAAAAAAASREAAAAFGDSRIFLERALASPRHIEIQIFADSHGHAVYLGERECSIQRRHQKVMEESPSPVLTPQLRAAMGEAALRVVRAAGYVNAGTVEFLFADDEFYFLEVNTRIQVEHPVTEMVTGLDLVRLQIEIAAGRHLRLSQLDVAARGHAIEARLYAEDPARGFLPATGRLHVFTPPEGPGIRNDVGVEPGAEVSPHYDPILAKLIVRAETRGEALARLRSALDDYGILGVATNQSFLRWVAGTPAFAAGHMDTGFVDREWPEAKLGEALPPEVLLLAVAFDVNRSQRPNADHQNPWLRSGNWRASAASRRYVYEWSGEQIAVDAVPRTPGAWDVAKEGEAPEAVRVVPGESSRLTVLRGRTVITGFAVETGGGIDISWRGTAYHLQPPAVSSETGEQGARAGQERLLAPMPGTVVRVLVRPGQAVTAHEPLVVMEAMKMEHVIEAPHPGVVGEVMFHEGDMVPAGSPLVRLEEP